MVPCDLQVFRTDNATQGDDCDVRRSSSDIYYHIPDRLFDRQTDAYRRRHRLLYYINVARAAIRRRIAHRAGLHIGHSRRNANNYARTQELPGSLLRPAYEIRDHFFRDFEIRYDSLDERPYRGDMRRSASEHSFCLISDSDDLFGLFVHSDHGGFVDYDAAPSGIDQRVRRS